MVHFAQERSAAAGAGSVRAFDHVERCGSGHSPFLSMPEFVVGFLERAIERSGGGV
jgi:hypothetical protein